ncbi:MAG: hypothetical protein ACKO4U_13620 [Caldilinea sp.]
MPIHIAYLVEEVENRTPGVRIVVPMDDTPQAQRGNLCALVDLQGHPSDGSLTERILSAMQRTYYSERGTQSEVITQTVRRAQSILAAEAQQLPTPWQAGVICVGIMADRLALAGLGNAFAFLTDEDGSIGVFPQNRLAPQDPLSAPSLELWPLHRQRVSSPTAMVAGSAEWLELVSIRTLAATTAYVDAGSCIDAAEGLRIQAGRSDVPGVVLIVDPENPAPEPPPSPPTSDSPASSGKAPLAGAPSPGRPKDSPAASKVSAALAGSAQATRPAAQTATETDRPPKRHSAPPDWPPSILQQHGWQNRAKELAATAQVGIRRTRDLLASMLPDRREEFPAAPSPRLESSSPAQPRTPLPPPKVQPAAAPFLPPAPATGSRARIVIASAVILLLLIPTVVAALSWRQGAERWAEADVLLSMAEARHATASQNLDQKDLTAARSTLTEANTFLLNAEEITGRTQRSEALFRLIERDRQEVERITALYGLTLPLLTFEPDQIPAQLMVVGQDLFLLDTGRSEVVAYRLAPDNESLESLEGQVVLRKGEDVDGATVGTLIDFAWQPPTPGYDDKSSLLVLDDTNQIFRYNQQVDGASALLFGDNVRWGKATQIEAFLGRLYVADEEANQIFRFEIGRYDQPAPWFQPTTQVALDGLTRMRIDGDIWLLYNDSKVVRYRTGEQLPFGLSNSVTLPAQANDLWVDPEGDGAIYLVDRPSERILVFNKQDGSYLEQFQAAEGTPLQNVQSLFIDRTHNTQFILTASALYQESLPR